MLDPGAAAATFALILPAELPDKTLVATLVLATRYRPWPVWIGVSLAFVVQTTVAVVAGGLLAQLPRTPVLAVTAALFAIGAVLLFRAADEDPLEEEAEVKRTPPAEHSARKIAVVSFGVLFAAEWGDLSQLLTAGLAARYDDPLGVFVGAWTALALVAAIAVVAGRGLLRVISVVVVRRVAGTLFAGLAIVTALEAAGVIG
ncbi:MAG: TMEM165/GDT1 family protein [Actinomycetes bacterium]